MPAFRAACAALESHARGSAFACVFALALLLRAWTGLHPHSGEATPPKFGDYEARTHSLSPVVMSPRFCAHAPLRSAGAAALDGACAA